MYSKVDDARFLGAKEVSHLFARAVRRARLPIAYSQGFHPLPRISFGPALPMGIESEEEFVDLELSEHLEAAAVGSRLDAEFPRGFHVQQAETIDLRTTSIDADIKAFRYVATLDSLATEKRTVAFLATQLSAYHAVDTFPLRKHSRSGEKIVDAKHFVASVALSTPLTLALELRMTEAGTIKPHDFVGALLALTAEETKILHLRKIQTLFHSATQSTEVAEQEEGATMPLISAAT
jgi:radical SAM-linked protein